VAWLRLDDKFAQHPKVADLSDRAFRVHVVTMLYCTEYATKGRIPRPALRLAGAGPKTVNELVDAGVWEQAGEELEVHDFAIYNGATIGERVDAFLRRFPGTSANEVHKALGGKREVVLSEVARYQSGSQSGSEGTGLGGSQTGTQGTAKVVPSAGAREPVPIPTPEEPLGESSALPGDGSKTTGAAGLPFQNERLVVELLAAIGDDADEGTPAVVRSIAAKLPEGAIAKVIESVRSSRKRNRAEYAVKALQGEWEDRHNDEHGSRLKDLRSDPETWVRELGWKMPPDVLEDGLFAMVADEDERIRLTDLAADLREGAAA
jgi:hypothetical protein